MALLDMTPPMAASSPVAADFRILSGAMEIAEDGTPSRAPIVRMVGSSTERDLHEDTMATSALQDMCNVSPNLLIWLNHDYTLPDSLFGALTDTPEIRQHRGVADLHLAAEVEMSNEAAVKTYGYIQRGKKLGCSVGVQVLEYAIEGVDNDDDEEMFWAMLMGAPITITHVKAVEWSVVGIPANQRSWVENAIRGVFQKSLDIRLAPAVKGLFPADYQRIVSQIPDDTVRQKYLGVPARGSRGELKWDLNRKCFEFKSINGSTIDVARESVADLIKSQVQAQSSLTARPPKTVTKAKSDPDGGVDDATEGSAKQAQEDRSTKYHIGIKEGGHVTKPGEWKDVPDAEWGDPVNYRYPMPDKSHADNAASRWGDAANRSQYSSSEQKIIGDRIEARQRHFGESSDEKKESAMNGITTKAAGAASGDQMVINPDGSHDPCSMTHAHAHAAYGMGGEDDTHEHEHSHNNDNDHHHQHADGMQQNAANGTHTHADGTPHTHKGTSDLTDDERAILLRRYNALGAELGLSEVTGDAGGQSDPQHSATDLEAIEAVVLKALELTKAGRKVSDESMRHVQEAHDALHRLSDGRCCMECQLQTVPEAEQQARESRDEGNGNSGTGTTLALSLTRFAAALETLSFDAVQSEVRGIMERVKEARTQLDIIEARRAALEQNVQHVQNMPLGRPTAMTRSVTQQEGIATYKI